MDGVGAGSALVGFARFRAKNVFGKVALGAITYFIRPFYWIVLNGLIV